MFLILHFLDRLQDFSACLLVINTAHLYVTGQASTIFGWHVKAGQASFDVLRVYKTTRNEKHAEGKHVKLMGA
jgi:hypothetical protein